MVLPLSMRHRMEDALTSCGYYLITQPTGMHARGIRGPHWISHRLWENLRLLSFYLNAVRIRMFVTATGGAQEKKHWRTDTAGSQSYCRSTVLVKRSP